MTPQDARILVIGAGGLGCPVLVGLGSAGVSRITLLDDDTVDATNLGRQMLFSEADVGRRKAEAAAEAIRARFPNTHVSPRIARFDRTAESHDLVAAHDLVIDGSDNFATRFAANDLCCALGVPLVHGAALQWLGQLLTIVPGRSPCLRCLFEGEPPPGAAPTCAQAGVIAPLVGLVGAWMAESAVDLLSGRWPSSAGRMRMLDAWTGRERFAEVGRDPSCRACAGSPVAAPGWWPVEDALACRA